MTHPENGKPLWDESRVESLLEEFFRREIPAPLAGPNPSRRQRSPLATASHSAGPKHGGTNSRAHTKTGGLMVGFTLLIMLMVVMVVSNPSRQEENAGPSAGGHSAKNSDLESADREEDASDALRHNGGGPIELRPRIQSVGTDDSENSDPKKSPFPELDVEVYPLDGETPRGKDKPRKSSPSETPMPEEGRTLPESQAPAADPDEARLEPMLPELRAVFPASGLD